VQIFLTSALKLIDEGIVREEFFSVMGRSVMSFCFTAIALFSSLAFGLFEEQAGEYDWKIESIGAIQQSFNKVKSVLLCSDVKCSASCIFP
jgi:hypothetical protein